ncbi:hypothetical protein HZS_1377 [Henneguya salminicola]|nr:hypothetical protein HZS_1377 [Henneguya salminicola]
MRYLSRPITSSKFILYLNRLPDFKLVKCALLAVVSLWIHECFIYFSSYIEIKLLKGVYNLHLNVSSTVFLLGLEWAVSLYQNKGTDSFKTFVRPLSQTTLLRIPTARIHPLGTELYCNITNFAVNILLATS